MKILIVIIGVVVGFCSAVSKNEEIELEECINIFL